MSQRRLYAKRRLVNQAMLGYRNVASFGPLESCSQTHQSPCAPRRLYQPAGAAGQSSHRFQGGPNAGTLCMSEMPPDEGNSDRIESILSGQIPNEIRLFRLYGLPSARRRSWCQIFQKAGDVRTLPRSPREIGLGLARHQSPVNGTHLISLGERQMPSIVLQSCRHILREDDRPSDSASVSADVAGIRWGLVVVDETISTG